MARPETFEISQEQWDHLARLRVLFGHQSVGQNIVDGLREVAAERGDDRLNIRNTTNLEDFSSPVFAHFLVGQNMDPHLKIDHFKRILDSGLARVLDVAMFKFCYIDITQSTDLERLARHYDDAIESLYRSYPRLRIITITTPLTAIPSGIKSKVKDILGRYALLKADNLLRFEFNERQRGRYGIRVFDLAAIEASRPDGTSIGFRKGTRFIPLLNPSYTDDGGHLNSIAKRIAARWMLIHLFEQTTQK